MRRRAMLASAAMALGLTLSACSSPPPTPAQLYRLPLAAPGTTASSGTPALADASSTVHWQIVRPVTLPELIDRDALLLPAPGTGVLRPSGHSWAEPLRDAVPRVLWHDLARQLGQDRVVLGTAPPGWPVQAQLRLTVMALEATPDQRQVRLMARWSLADPAGARTAQLGQVDLSVPVGAGGSGPEALVAAHRMALADLADRLARAMRAWPAAATPSSPSSPAQTR